MRISDYTIFVDLKQHSEDSHLLIHGYSGAFDLVPTELATTMKVLAGASLSGDTLRDALGEGHIEVLKRRGYLTEWGPEEEQAFFLRYVGQFHSYTKGNAPHFMIMPSYECNLRCPYCYQEDPGARHLQAKKGFELPDEATMRWVLGGVQALAREFTTEKTRNHPSVTFYGGEPLLAKHRPIVEMCLEVLRFEPKVEFRAISNGTELDAYAGLLGPGGIQELQITLDGAASIHNRRRVTGKGEGTFDRIVKNVSFALQQGTRINLRINVDRSNLDSLPSLAVEIRRLGWCGSTGFSAYLAPVQSNKNDTNQAMLLETRRFHASIEELGREHPDMELFHFPNVGLKNQLLRLLQSGSDPAQSIFKPTFCGAHTVMFIIDFSGAIYACMERTNEPSARIGQLLPDGRFELFEGMLEHWRNRSVATTAPCSTCSYALFCAGGCAVKQPDAAGHCDDFQYRFDQAAANAWGDFSRGERASSWEGHSC